MALSSLSKAMRDQQVVRISSPFSGSSVQHAEGRRCTFYINAALLAAFMLVLLTNQRDEVVSGIRGGLFASDDTLVLKYKGAGEGSDDSAGYKKIMPGRFPTLGSEEFQKQCPWTSMSSFEYRNCTIYMTLRPEGHDVSHAGVTSVFFFRFLLQLLTLRYLYASLLMLQSFNKSIIVTYRLGFPRS